MSETSSSFHSRRSDRVMLRHFPTKFSHSPLSTVALSNRCESKNRSTFSKEGNSINFGRELPPASARCKKRVARRCSNSIWMYQNLSLSDVFKRVRGVILNFNTLVPKVRMLVRALTKVKGWGKRAVPRLRESRLLTPSGCGAQVNAT